MAPTRLSTELPVEELITGDHRELLALAEQALAEPTGPAPRELVRRLVPHAEAEEAMVYPLVKAEVPGGGELAGHSIEEHQRIEGLLKELDDAVEADPEAVDAAEVSAVLRRLEEELRHHIGEEESKLLPALVAQVDDERRRGLGADFRSMKDAAPTRPHPLAPDSGPVNAVAGAMAAPIDKLRDAREDRARARATGEDRP